MRKIIYIAVPVLALISFVVITFLKIERFPANAKLCGEHWISCSIVKRGLYHCRVYDKSKRKIRDQTFMYPYMFWSNIEPDLTSRAVKYEEELIVLDGKKRLIPCTIPEDADLIQGLGSWVWVSYAPESNGKNQYVSTVYNVKDGSIVSSGLYILKEHNWDNSKGKIIYKDPEKIIKYFKLFYYGGVGISLQNKMVLMPLGWIDYPIGPRTGVRVKYDEYGKELYKEQYR